MTLLQGLLAGILQGATEFLPVSSSGHLVVLNVLFGYDEAGGNLAFAVFLHLATLVSVVIVFRKDLAALVREAFTAMLDLLRGKPDFTTPERRFLLMIVMATIPAVAAGLGIKLLGFSDVLENVFVVAVMFLGTAALMFTIDRLPEGTYTEADAPPKAAFTVGLMQAIAILPGLSRSGSTIFGGVLGGLKREFAIRFAFILSIPVILGAALLEGLQAAKTNIVIDPLAWGIGFIAAMIVGIMAIKFIELLAKHKRFYVFGIYCLGASVFALLVGLGVI